MSTIGHLWEFFLKDMIDIPNPDICKTRHAYADFWECLVDYEAHAYKCAYIIGINSTHFCMHHKFRDFAVGKCLLGEDLNGV